MWRVDWQLSMIRCKPENTIVGRPPGWVHIDVSQLYISINPLSQVVCGCPWSLLQSLGAWRDAGNWRAASSLPDRCIGNASVYGIRRILLRDYASKASTRQARAYVIVHASDPCHNSMGPPKYRNPWNPIDVWNPPVKISKSTAFLRNLLPKSQNTWNPLPKWFTVH